MKAVESNGSWALPFMSKVMVWCFVNDIHKVMTAFVLIMCVGLARADIRVNFQSIIVEFFSAISYIGFCEFSQVKVMLD
jgi:hypothetical protein